MPILKNRPSRSDFEREAMPHLSALYAAAVRMTRNERDAEDMVQDAMLRAYRFFDTFQPGTNCKAWLFRILTNVFCNRYREREREHEILTQAESSDVNVEQFLSGAAEIGRDTENALLGRMISADVERALAAVPQDFRMAVILSDLEDFSYKEIAEIMDCPAGTVMSRLFRGRKILQGLLHEYAVEQGIISDAGKPSQAKPAEPARAKGDAPGAPVDIADYRRRRHAEAGRKEGA
jgi:RNA polymerase sigma-70 factor (ECF subfamily)